MNEITTEEKLREIEREIAIRERLYPDWVKVGRLSKERAHKQIEILRAVAQDYRDRLK